MVFNSCAEDISHRCVLYPRGSHSKLNFPSNPSVKSYLRLSGDTEAASSVVAGVHMALSEGAVTALLGWTPFDTRLCAVRHRGLCKVNSRRSDRSYLFVVLTYA